MTRKEAKKQEKKKAWHHFARKGAALLVTTNGKTPGRAFNGITLLYEKTCNGNAGSGRTKKNLFYSKRGALFLGNEKRNYS